MNGAAGQTGFTCRVVSQEALCHGSGSERQQSIDFLSLMHHFVANLLALASPRPAYLAQRPPFTGSTAFSISTLLPHTLPLGRPLHF